MKFKQKLFLYSIFVFAISTYVIITHSTNKDYKQYLELLQKITEEQLSNKLEINRIIRNRTTHLQPMSANSSYKTFREIHTEHSQQQHFETKADIKNKIDPKINVSANIQYDGRLQKTFDDIARKHYWGGGNETVSGPGSILASTEAVRRCIGLWISKYNIRSIVDVACGDANWQRYIPGIQNVHYTGFDISRYAVERAKKKNPQWTFDVLDITRSIPLKADLIIMRDALQHLPLDMGKQAVMNIIKSNTTWFGVTTYTNIFSNRNIQVGQYYHNNVAKPPFSLPNPMENCDNYSDQEKKSHPGCKFFLINLKDIR